MTTTPDLGRNPFTDNATTAGLQDSGVVAATSGNQFFAVYPTTSLRANSIA
jgi:hypothetical protein